MNLSSLGAFLTLGLLSQLMFANKLTAVSNEQKFLQMVPGGVVTLPMIVDIGYRFSDAIIQLKAELEAKELPVLMASQSTDGVLSGRLAQSADKSQQSSPFGVEVNSAQDLNFSWQQYLSTGTSVTTSLGTRKSDLNFLQPGVSGAGTYTSQLNIAVRQSLWKNRFGKVMQENLLSAKENQKVIEQQYQLSLGLWLLQIEQIYHQAWLAQNSVKYAKDRVKTQKRLLKIIKLLQKRGTAEASDVLNVEQNLIRIEQGSRLAQKSLINVWQQLVIVLKLPSEFLDIDPSRIPIAPSPISKSLSRYCSKDALPRMLSPDKPRFAMLDSLEKAATLDISASENKLSPDLYLAAEIGSNGIDDDLGETIGDAMGLANQKYALAIGIELPLGNSAAKADLVNKKKSLILAKTNLSSQKTDVRITWRTACSEVRTLKADIEMYKKMLTLNKRRSKMEEGRFALGKVDAQTVILAANDVIFSQEALSRAKVGMINAVWQLKELDGEAPGYIEDAVKNSKLR